MGYQSPEGLFVQILISLAVALIVLAVAATPVVLIMLTNRRAQQPFTTQVPGLKVGGRR